MKFVVSSSTLLNTLQATGKVISSKNTLPILDYFLFDLEGESLKVTASDLETTMIGNVEVQSIEKHGVIAVPAKLIVDSLREFSEQPLTIEANESTWEVTVKWKTGQLTIPGTSGMSYPKVQTTSDDATHKFSIEAGVLMNSINKTVFAMAEDELRPVMNGVFVNIEPSSVTFVATDAHKLVRYKVNELQTGITSSFILAKKPANLLRNILGKGDDMIEIEFDNKNVIFNMAKHTLVCRLIEGNYPNYNAVIPVNNPNKVLVDRLEVLNGIKRVAVCSNQATNLIKIDIESGSINITAQDIDFSVSAQEKLPCNYEGPSISIGFKSTFLVEIFSNLDTNEVQVELADSTRAGVFRPVGEELKDEMLMLLMPMMINA